MARDYREALDPESDPVTFAEAVAHLYSDEDLNDRVRGAIVDLLHDIRDGEDAADAVASLSDDDLALIADRMATRADSGLFVLRSGVLTVADAALTTDHAIHMASAAPDAEGRIIEYDIVEADPDAVDVAAQVAGSSRITRFGVGQLLHSDRFEVVE